MSPILFKRFNSHKKSWYITVSVISRCSKGTRAGTPIEGSDSERGWFARRVRKGIIGGKKLLHV